MCYQPHMDMKAATALTEYGSYIILNNSTIINKFYLLKFQDIWAAIEAYIPICLLILPHNLSLREYS